MRSDERRLVARCRELAGSLPLPTPWSVAAFLDELAGAWQRPIEFKQVEPVAGSPCGVLVRFADRDVIGYVPSSPLHEEHILLHEVAHLVCGHADSTVADSAMVRELLPDLPPELIKSVLGRTSFDQHEEQEAEWVASLYLYRAGRRPLPSGTRAADGPMARTLHRITSVFDGP